MAKKTAREIDQDAADWASKVDRGLSPAEQSELDLWLDGDRRRPGAYTRMRAISLQSERAAALGLGYDPAQFLPAAAAQPWSRRGALLAGGGLAAGAAGLAILGKAMLDRGQDYITQKGEVRQIALQDGSVVTLNTATHLAVRFSSGRRDVHLVQGEALFEVAKDVSRPFSVAAGATLARVVGTSFTVTRLRHRPVQILVREGIVEVKRLGSVKLPPVTLVANTRALDPGQSTEGEDSAPAFTITSVANTELHRELAWRDGQIAFEGQTLLEAASEFARYSDTRIIVEDPSLGREEIAGLYRSNDPVGFARAVAESFNAHAEILDGAVRISR